MFIKKIFVTVFIISLFISTNANAIDTKAKQAVLMDFDTGEILFERKADEKMPPASMSKLMTVYMIFERLHDGRLSLDDEFTVSENAWKKGGTTSGSSTMFLPPRAKVKIQDLIRGIIVQSGNDACITVAENISGSEADFADDMTVKAKMLGLEHSSFRNATGWPNENHYMSPLDLAKLSRILIKEFPEYYSVFSEKSFHYNGIRQSNRNPLLYRMERYADGLKTGHTESSGYGLVSSAKKNGRRLILVVNGLSSNKERGEESEKLMRWGFREFDNYSFFDKGEVVVNAPVWLGVEKDVPLIIKDEVLLTLNPSLRKRVKVKAVYDGPIESPILKDTKIGKVIIDVASGRKVYEYPLYAGKDIKRLGLFGRAKEMIKYLVLGNPE
jgi:D-alanyl-D-alanine carboxypeptidase (penicillin-binding protein 5/6)